MAERDIAFGRTRSRILVKTTLLLSAVIILSGLGTFFLVRNSQQNIADKCEDCMLEMGADNCCDSYDYVVSSLYPTYAEQFAGIDTDILVESTLNGEITEVQAAIISDIREMLASGFLGLERFMLIIPPSALLPKPMVWVCDDESLVYEWEVPEDFTDAIARDDQYLWREEGIPDIGLEGEYLVTLGKVDGLYSPSMSYAYAAFRPMQEEMDINESFFNEEKKSANLLLVSTITGSIALILAAVFFLLGFLIHRRITKPLDELSTAAAEVMQGNLDVEVEVREGEEFTGLKTAFKEMVEGFRHYIDMSVGEGLEGGAPAAEKAKPAVRRKKKLGILWLATIILVAIMAVYGVADYFILRHTQDRLIDSGVKRMVQTEVDLFRSSIDYTISMNVPRYIESFERSDLQQILSDLAAGRMSELQESVSEDMRKVTEAGYNNIDTLMLAVPAGTMNPEIVVWACNDESLIYDRECPACIIEAIENGEPYRLIPEGIPELGIQGECLVTINQVDNPLIPSIPFDYIAVRPIGLEMTAINDFCDSERARANLYLMFILEGSIILVILIGFLYLNHLLKKEVVEPVDELSVAAEKVMQGDFDAEVSVREGEELEGLKRAFNEMVKGIRDMFSRFFNEGE